MTILREKGCLNCTVYFCYRWYKGPICANCYRKDKYKKNPEKVLKNRKDYVTRKPKANAESCKKSYLKNKKFRIQAVKKWQKKNPELVKIYIKKSLAKEENRVKRRLYGQKHYKNKKHLYRAKDANYRAIKLNATPKWADLAAIKEFYKNCPKGHHVDHVIPLQGKLICGLHILENLQYLPASENLSKGNKYE